jgi:hypothetical protein
LPPPHHGELRLPGVFHPNYLRSTLPLFLSVLQALATTSADHRSSPPTTKRRCLAPPPPPLYRVAASVRPRRYHLALHFPPFVLELPPPVPPRLVAPLDADGRATVGAPCAVTTWCACRAASTGRPAGPPFGIGLPCGLGRRAPALWRWAVFSPTMCPGLKSFSICFKYPNFKN